MIYKQTMTAFSKTRKYAAAASGSSNVNSCNATTTKKQSQQGYFSTTGTFRLLILLIASLGFAVHIFFSAEGVSVDYADTVYAPVSVSVKVDPNSKAPAPVDVDVDVGDVDVNTAVIVTSSWIPTHPSTHMIDTVIQSIRTNLVGLNKDTTPIFIMVDAIRWSPPKTKTRGSDDNIVDSFKEYEERTRNLDKYISNLYAKYLVVNPNIHIVVSTEHHHIGGNVWKALQLIKDKYPSVQYLYSAQHDFEFSRRVDHTSLIHTMNQHNTKKNETTMNYVLFQYKGHEMRSCDRDRKIMVEGLSRNNHTTTTTTNASSSSSSSSRAANNSTSIKNAVLCKSCKYSDNNHLVRFDWYYKFIGDLIGFNKRSPEGPGQYSADRRCEQMGLYLYYSAKFEIGKKRGVDYALRHLDGRRTGQ